MTQPAPSLAEVAPHSPAGLVEVVDRALRVAREQRWQSANAMQQAIRTLRAQYPGELPKPRAGASQAGAPTIGTPVPTADRSPSGVTEYAPPAALTPPAVQTPAPGAVFTSPSIGATASAAYAAGPPPGTTSGLAVAEAPRGGGRGLLLGLLGGAIVVAVGLAALVVFRAPSTGGADAKDETGTSVAAATAVSSSEATEGTETTTPPDTTATATETAVATAAADAGAAETPTAAAPPKTGTGTPGTGRLPKTGTTAPKTTAAAKPANPLGKW